MKNHVFIFSLALLLCTAALFAMQAPVAAADKLQAAMVPLKNGPNVNNWWGNSFDPATSMTALIEDKLTNSKRFTMYNREHLMQIMQEHNLAIAGEVSPESAKKIGELTNVKYLVTGKIVEFAEVNSGGSSGFSVGFGIGVSSSSKGNKKVRVKTQVMLMDTETSVNAASVTCEKEIQVSSGGGSFYIGGTGGGSEGGETNASGLGKGMEEVAKEIVSKLESMQITTASLKKIEGYVMDMDGDQIYITINTPDDIKKIASGRKFKVTRSKSIKDPQSLQVKTINKPVGEIQVVSVDGTTIICKPAASCEPVQKNDRVVTEVVEEK